MNKSILVLFMIISLYSCGVSQKKINNGSEISSNSNLNNKPDNKTQVENIESKKNNENDKQYYDEFLKRIEEGKIQGDWVDGGVVTAANNSWIKLYQDLSFHYYTDDLGPDRRVRDVWGNYQIDMKNKLLILSPNFLSYSDRLRELNSPVYGKYGFAIYDADLEYKIIDSIKISIELSEKNIIKTESNGLLFNFNFIIKGNEIVSIDNGYSFGFYEYKSVNDTMKFRANEVLWIKGSINASSVLTDSNNSYDANNAFDANVSTSWLENLDGNGIGSYIELELENEISINKIEVYPGVFLENFWKLNNRLKKCEMSFDDQKFIFSYDDSERPFYHYFNEMVRFKKFKLTILEVYNTNKWDDSGVSEIVFYLDKIKYRLN